MKRLSKASFRLSSKDADKIRESTQQNSPPAMRDLQEFLSEADLGEYFSPLCSRLKVTTVDHLKYVREEDLEDIGMTRPEMRRLKKFYRKEFPQGTFNKLKKAFRGGDGSNTNSSRTLSPSPTEHRSSKTGSPSISAPSTPGRHPPSRQLIPSDALELQHTLGEGEFGVVLQATWTVPESGEKLPVAVKKLLRDKVSNGTQTFLKEAAITQDMEHDSIVRLYGVVLDQDQDIMLVTELAPLRSLLECLHDESLKTDLGLPRLCDFAQQVCEGMMYLEAKRMVHRDLAARNVLVFNKSQVKVSDLGLSRALGVGQDYYQSASSAGLKLPIAWCAPECINFLRFTSSSDVWAFGVLLWECFTYGQQPWEGMNTQQVLETIDAPQSQRLPQPDLCTPEFYQTMMGCWSHTPEDRPPFSSLLVQLPQLRPTQVRAIKDYPKPTVDAGYICYKQGDVIVVVDKMPATNAPAGLVWKGVLKNGAVGLFDPTHVAPFIEPKISPLAVQKTSLARKESGRKSGRKILRADMISRPQNDLRHTGHIGYDGAVFGDVSFIGNNYDKLPLKVEGTAGAENDQMRSGNSQDSLESPGQNGLQQSSWLSRDSLSSQATVDTEGRQSPSYLDVEDDSLFSDFKMPDFGSSLDFGGSFMDEVLKALDAKEKEVSSNKATPSDDNSYSEVRPDEAPTPVPRGSIKSSVPPLPSQPPRNDPPPPKEKKQAKVKPMSTSDERIMEAALANARELTALRSPGECHSPTVNNEKSHFFNDDSPGFVSKLRNSLRKSTSPKSERKRTFSDELESKGDIADELTPEAQQAYNVLVVKGEGSTSGGHNNDQTYLAESDMKFSSSTDCNGGQMPKDQEEVFHPEPIHRRSNGTPPRVIPHRSLSNTSNNGHPTQPPPQPPTRPLISAPLPQNKPVAITHPTTTSTNNASSPVPAPRPPKPETTKKPEAPVPKPRPEIQRVEPTIRHTVPDTPQEMEHKSHIPISRNSSSTSKEKEREDLKKTIEIVRVEESTSIRDRDELSEKTSSNFDRSSARSSQRSSLDRSDATSENAESERAEWEHSEYSSDGSRPDPRANLSFGSGSTERQDSFNNKKQLQSSSLFEEDLSEPSPQEIMNRLREKRLNRHLDHQRALTGEGDGSSSAPAPRQRPNAREPQGIPGRAPSVDLEDGGGGEGSDEVDTNPLRMLRGGAIPIRTGRGSAGNHGNQGTRGAFKALRVPALNFSSPLSRLEASLMSSPSSSSQDRIIYATIQPHTAQTKEYEEISNLKDNHNVNLDSSTTTTAISPPHSTSTCANQSSVLDTPVTTIPATTTTTTTSDAAAELMLELNKLTSTLMEGDLSKVASAVAGRRTSEDEIRKFTEQGLKIDLTKSIPISSDGNSSHERIDNNNNNDNNTKSFNTPTHYTQNRASPPLLTSKAAVNVHSPKAAVVSSSTSPSDSQTPPAIPQRPNIPTSMKIIETSSVPPRLPPRRTQSLTENADKSQSISSAHQHCQRTRELRRSNSLEEPDMNRTPTPPLPPRVPQSSSFIVSTNPKSRERKFPLSLRPPPSNCNARQMFPVSPTSTRKSNFLSDISKSNPISLPERQPILSSRSPLSSSPASSSSSSSSSHRHFQHSRSVDSHHPHLSQRSHLHNQTFSDLDRSFDSCPRPIRSSRSFDLPPTDTDSEPTHMLLESPPSQFQVPSLVVNLPSTSDYKDEPTHIPLSWSASLPANASHSNSPSSQGRSSSSNANKFAYNRSASFHAPIMSRYPSLADHQSPPADLPPAPPTPSYREKLGLPTSSHKSSLLTRSVSHDITTTKLSSLPGQPPPLSPRNVNNLSSPISSGRRRSSSMNSPNSQHNAPPPSYAHHHHHHHHPSSVPASFAHPLVSPMHTTKAQQPMSTIFRYPDIDNLEMGDDDAFFSEAPSVPHPYSQSPFRPIISVNKFAQPTQPTDTNSHHSLSNPTPHLLHPHSSSPSPSSFHNKVGVTSSSRSPPTSINTNLNASVEDVPPPISPRTTSRGVIAIKPPSPLSNNNSSQGTNSSSCNDCKTKVKNCQSVQQPSKSNPALPPRSPIPVRSPIPATTSPPSISPQSPSNESPYLRLSSASSSPTHAPLPSPTHAPLPSPTHAPFSSHNDLNISTSSDDEYSGGNSFHSHSPVPPPRFNFVSSKTESESMNNHQPLPLKSTNQYQHQSRAVSSPPPPSASTRSSATSAAAATASPSTLQHQQSSSSQPPPPPSSSSSSSFLTTASEYGEVDLSPTMLASYKNSSTVSYEDLMEFALDRQKNCEEIETLLNIFQNEVKVEDCMVALENTRWDVTKATKYIQLKKLLCIGIADVHQCKESLIACGWDVERAAEALLESSRPGEASAAVEANSALHSSTNNINDDGQPRPSSILSSSSSTQSSSSLASSSSLSLSSTSSSRISPARSVGGSRHSVSPGREDGIVRGGCGGGGGGGVGEEGEEFLSSTESSLSSFGPPPSSNDTNRAPTSPESVNV